MNHVTAQENQKKSEITLTKKSPKEGQWEQENTKDFKQNIADSCNQAHSAMFMFSQ